MTETAQLPRIVADSSAIASVPVPQAGAAWRLAEDHRDLDANIIALPPGERIEAHDGPNLDVLIHVLSGSGTLTTAAEAISLMPGLLVWLPRRSNRQFLAGPDGLQYFSVHQRKPGLTISSARPA